MGTRFARYELIDRIGVGGMAEAFLACAFEADGTERHVVVKRILPHLSTDLSYREMLTDEARIASQLDHPNVVRLFEFGRLDGQLFLALEFVDGASVEQLLKHSPPKGLAAPIAIALDVLGALDHAHSRVNDDGTPMSIIHRDVSAANVLVSRDGVAKLTDFGIAKAKGRLSRTAIGVVKGNVLSSAPEQLLGEEIDSRADVYAAGMLLHTLLIGRHPLARFSLREIVAIHTRGTLPVPSEGNADVPPALDDIVRRATANTPDARTPTAAHVAHELRRFARESGISLDSPGVREWVADATGGDAVPTGPAPTFASKPFQTLVGKSDPSLGSEVVLETRVITRDTPLSGALETVPSATQIVPDEAPSLEMTPSLAPLEETPIEIVELGTDSMEMTADQDPLRLIPVEAPVQTPTPIGVAPAALEEPTSTRTTVNARESIADAFSGPPLAAPPPRSAPPPPASGPPPPPAFAPPAPRAAPSNAAIIPAPPPVEMFARPEAKPARKKEKPSRTEASTRSALDSVINETLTTREPAASGGGIVDRIDVRPARKRAPSDATPSGGTPAVVGGVTPQNPRPATTPGFASPGPDLKGHLGSINAIAWGGGYVVSAGHDRTVRVWDPASQKIVCTLRGHTNAVNTIALDPDAKTLVSGGRDGTIRTWEIAGFRSRETLTSHKGWVFSVAITAAGQILSGGDDRALRIWSGSTPVTIPAHLDAVSAVVSPGPGLAITGSYDRTIKTWDLEKQIPFAMLQGELDRIRTVAADTQGRILAGDALGQVRLVDAASGNVIARLDGHHEPVVGATFSPDGRFAITGGFDGTIRAWNLSSAEQIGVIDSGAEQVLAVALAPDGTVFAACGETIRTWKTTLGS